VRMAYPGKAGETALLAEYAKEDSAAPAAKTGG